MSDGSSQSGKKVYPGHFVDSVEFGIGQAAGQLDSRAGATGGQARAGLGWAGAGKG